jgi:hypothetical protein
VAELQDMIDSLHRLGELPEKLAPKVAAALLTEVSASVARGESPDGKAWQPTKDGKRPLQNAAKALRAEAVGTVALLILEGPEVRHHLGSAKGGVQRQILPSRKLNASAVRALQRVAAESFSGVMRGA